VTSAAKPLVTPRESRDRAAAALLPKFIGHRERDAGAIRAALEHGDFEVIVTLGHNMRGNGPSYGFPEIGAIGERLEAAAGARDARRVGEQVAALEAWITHAKEVLIRARTEASHGEQAGERREHGGTHQEAAAEEERQR
jgi:HPt (histidine-containing phosphotransfer) domain-containing protein